VLGYCFNCLAKSHLASACTSPHRCRFCQRKHNTLLHVSRKPRRPQPAPEAAPVTVVIATDARQVIEARNAAANADNDDVLSLAASDLSNNDNNNNNNNNNNSNNNGHNNSDNNNSAPPSANASQRPIPLPRSNVPPRSSANARPTAAPRAAPTAPPAIVVRPNNAPTNAPQPHASRHPNALRHPAGSRCQRAPHRQNMPRRKRAPHLQYMPRLQNAQQSPNVPRRYNTPRCHNKPRVSSAQQPRHQAGVNPNMRHARRLRRLLSHPNNLNTAAATQPLRAATQLLEGAFASLCDVFCRT